jgi:hypothetical protein
MGPEGRRSSSQNRALMLLLCAQKRVMAGAELEAVGHGHVNRLFPVTLNRRDARQQTRH